MASFGNLQLTPREYFSVPKLWSKNHNLNWYLPLKFQSFRTTVLHTFIRLWLVISVLSIGKSLNIVYFMMFQYFNGKLNYQTRLKLDRPALVMHRFWCKTVICSWILSGEVSLVLDDPFPAPFLCNLKHISLYFIQNSINITAK